MSLIATPTHQIRHRSSRALTRSIALEESRQPSFFKTGVFLIGLLVTLFIVWAALSNVQEKVTAPGTVTPSGYSQTVQHLEGGLIRDILVRDGDLVQAGQPLILLDATGATADLGQMLARQQALNLKAARLRKFVGIQPGGDAGDETLTPEEQAILTSMEQSRESQRQVLRDQISQKQKELDALNDNRTILQKNVALAQSEHDIHQTLFDRGYNSKLTALESERDLNGLKGQLATVVTQAMGAQDAIKEAQSRLQSLDADLNQQAFQQLGQAEADLSELTQSIAKYKDTLDRTSIKAPVRGIIKGMTINTVGAVVEKGKVLMEIVPLGEDLIAEAMIVPSSIGNLKPGQAVNLKVTAYDYARYGTVSGHLDSISASTFQTPEGASYYKARIKLDRGYVGTDPEKNLILPGMTLQADVITGNRTVLEYLLKPIYVAVEGGLHER